MIRADPGGVVNYNLIFPEMVEWSITTDCKSVGIAYAGSNPALRTQIEKCYTVYYSELNELI